jgi:endonuclease-3 related protein
MLKPWKMPRASSVFSIDSRMSSHTLHDIYSLLLSSFGPQQWWPGDSPWEIACGAVLTQNTNWTNVEKAIANLVTADSLCPQTIVAIEPTELATLIRPAGYFNLKAKRLRNLACWWVEHGAPEGVDRIPMDELRNDLLSVNGVGEETADSILLYAFERPTFVVDAYTKRFMIRHGLINGTETYGQVKALFENALPREVDRFNEYHALIVELGKNHCRPKPTCKGCPLEPLLADLGD